MSEAYDPDAEAKLLEGLRRGDEQAFEALVRDQSGRMLAVARRYLRTEDDARDAVQEAFLSAFRGIQKFEGGSRLSTWLHRIVVNACLMRLRTKRRKPEESIEDMLPAVLEDGYLAEPAERWKEGVDDLMERSENRRVVRDAIESLPEGHRAILLLRDIEEKDTDETAELLGISKGAVKTRLHRARLALRGQLDAHFREVPAA